MTDLITLQSAIDAVARRIVRRVVRDAIEIQVAAFEWEDYPEIGESDWERVLDRAEEISSRAAPSNGEYEAAYKFLADRATDETEGEQ